VPAVEIAAALAKIVQGDTPLLLPAAADKPRKFERDEGRPAREPFERRESAPRTSAFPADKPPRERKNPNAAEAFFSDDDAAPARPARRERAASEHDFAMETFRIEVGHAHGVQPGNIVGAIANEADLESRYIGRIDIRDDH